MKVHRVPFRLALVIAGIVTIVSLALEPAEALEFSVSARGSILVCCDANGQEFSDSVNTGTLAQTSTSIDLNPLPDPILIFALARLVGSAKVGALGTEATALASSPPNNFTQARATGDLTWVDDITIGGGTIGDEVALRATLELVGSIDSHLQLGRAEIASDVDFIDVRGGGNIKVATLDTFTCSASGVVGCTFPGDVQLLDSAIVTLHVGDSIRVMGSMFVEAFAQDGGFGVASFLDTAVFHLDPVTPGTTYITASGASYLTPAPVPEPATFALLGSALAVGALRHACRRRGA